MRIVLSVALLAACAPAYRPPAPFTPLLDDQGDAQVAVHLGTGGVQADAAYAVSDSVAVRGGLQGAGYSGPGHYAVATIGAGVYGADPAGGFRWAVTGQVGGGPSSGITDLTVTTTTPDGEQVSEQARFQNSGTILVGAVRPEIGFETEAFAIAATFGASYHQLHHDRASDGRGLGQGVLVEPVLVLRGGPPPVGIEAFAGLAWPVWITGDTGLALPIVLGLGITVDVGASVQ